MKVSQVNHSTCLKKIKVQDMRVPVRVRSVTTVVYPAE